MKFENTCGSSVYHDQSVWGWDWSAVIKWIKRLLPKCSEIQIPNGPVTFAERWQLAVVRLVTIPDLVGLYLVRCQSTFHCHSPWFSRPVSCVLVAMVHVLSTTLILQVCDWGGWRGVTPCVAKNCNICLRDHLPKFVKANRLFRPSSRKFERKSRFVQLLLNHSPVN